MWNSDLTMYDLFFTQYSLWMLLKLGVTGRKSAPSALVIRGNVLWKQVFLWNFVKLLWCGFPHLKHIFKKNTSYYNFSHSIMYCYKLLNLWTKKKRAQFSATVQNGKVIIITKRFSRYKQRKRKGVGEWALRKQEIKCWITPAIIPCVIPVGWMPEMSAYLIYM